MSDERNPLSSRRRADSWRLSRAVLLTLGLLSACAAGDVPADQAAGTEPSPHTLASAYGEYLASRFAMNQMDLPRAADDLATAVAITPQDPFLLQQAFIVALAAGRTSEALSLAGSLPQNELAQLLIADTDAKASKWGLALQIYAALPPTGLVGPLQPILIAWAQAGAGQVQAALATLKLATPAALGGFYVLHSAMIADFAGRERTAGNLYREAAGDFVRGNLLLARILASWLARNGHPDRARALLESEIEQNPALALALPGLKATVAKPVVQNATDGLALAYLAFADSLGTQDANALAIPLLRLALDLSPSFTEGRLLLSAAVGADDHPSAAFAALAPIPSSDPLTPIVDLRRAEFEADLGNIPAASQILDRLATNFPDNTEPLATLGDILARHKDYPGAVAAYTKAIAREQAGAPDLWALYYYRGIAEDQGGNWPKAEVNFKQSLRLSPDQPYVLNYLGYSWADQGRNLQQAKEMIAQALNAEPNDGAIIDSMGWVLFQEGHDRQALSYLLQAVALMPGDPTVNGHLGDALWRNGEHLQAIYQWRRALTLDPSPKQRRNFLERLQHGLPPELPLPAGQSD